MNDRDQRREESWRTQKAQRKKLLKTSDGRKGLAFCNNCAAPDRNRKTSVCDQTGPDHLLVLKDPGFQLRLQKLESLYPIRIGPKEIGNKVSHPMGHLNVDGFNLEAEPISLTCVKLDLNWKLPFSFYVRTCILSPLQSSDGRMLYLVRPPLMAIPCHVSHHGSM
jgi:hypothetical protein